MMKSGYDFLKIQVLSCWRKVKSVCETATSLSPPAECSRHGVQQPWTPGHLPLNVWQVAPSDDWCHHSVMSVGRADRQQERVVPDTAAHFRVKLYTSAQRPCNRSAPGCAASEGRQERRCCGPHWANGCWPRDKENNKKCYSCVLYKL